MTTTCIKCGAIGPLAPANVSRKTGERLFRKWCCACEKKRKDAWRLENKEHHNAKSAAWAKSNPEKRSEIRTASRAKRLTIDRDLSEYIEKTTVRKIRIPAKRMYRSTVNE